MTPLEQLLTGFALIGCSLTFAFALLWYREIDRNTELRRSRDMLRENIRKIGMEPPREHPLADAMLAATVLPRRTGRITEAAFVQERNHDLRQIHGADEAV